jgi:hypothetical protein
MIRTRSAFAVLRAIAVGSAMRVPQALGVTAALALSSTMLLGCQDESQPEYWVKKLDDIAARPAAIKRLTQFFEDGMTKSNNNRDTPEMKALLGKIVAPMTKAYVQGDLDEKTRTDLLKSLANTRDPGAKDAIVKAIADFSQGKSTAEELKQACNYLKQVKTPEAAGPLLDAFLKVKPSDPKTGPAYLAVKEAMLAMVDVSWKGKLIETLNRPVNVKEVQEGRNDVYWQTVSAEVLGEMGPKAADAAKPLLKIIVTPDKKDIAATAIVALTKIGKGAIVPAMDLLAGKDAELVDYAKKQTPQAPTQYIASAALVLGTIGISDAVPVLIDALNKADTDANRAILARELTKLPPSPDSIKAFEAAFEKLPVTATVPPGDPAKAALAEAASSMMDASLVPWILTQIKAQKGDKEQVDIIKSSLLQTAMKLAKKEQLEDVKKVVEVDGDKAVDGANFKLASDVVNACADNVGCYLAKIEEPAVQERNAQFTGIKAAYMLAIIGNDATKGEIVKRLPKVKNDAIRFVSVLAIDHLSPKGDAKIADELQALVDSDKARGVSGNGAIRQIIPRLRAR